MAQTTTAAAGDNRTKGRATRVWVSAVPVTDFDRALGFYRDLLGFPVQLDARSANWIEVGPDEPLAKIGLYVRERPAGTESVPTSGVVLDVDDMDAFARKLKTHGVKFTREPTKALWGGIVADFLDPDGNEIEAVDHPGHYDVVTSPDTSRRSAD